MAITATPLITKVINEDRREIVMSVEISDDTGGGDVRTLSGTGKAKTDAEGKRLMDSIVTRYKAERAHEAAVATIKTEMETEAKIYLEEQLNA